MRSISLACVVVTILASAAALAQDSPFGLARQVTGSITIDPSFSPDGARMVYITAVAGVQQLFIARPDGSEPTQITHDAFDHEVSFSAIASMAAITPRTEGRSSSGYIGSERTSLAARSVSGRASPPRTRPR